MYGAVMITHMKISKVGDIKYFASNYEEKTKWKNCLKIQSNLNILEKVGKSDIEISKGSL